MNVSGGGASVHICVLGAGVIGLTTALSILRKHPDYSVTVVAHKWPTDQKSIEYTSCWAGAHHVSTAPDERHQKLDTETFAVFWKMLQDDPDVPLMITTQTDFYDEEPRPGLDTFFLQKIMPEFRLLKEDELLPRTISGCTFKTITIDSPNYLRYLQQEFILLGGNTVPSPKLSSLEALLDIFRAPNTPSVVINCAGIGNAAWDSAVYPTRGQTVLVRAPWIKDSKTVLRDGEVTYVIPRRCGDVILGGTRHDGDWAAEPKEDITKGIKERCLLLMPDLLPEDKREGGTIDDLDVIEAGCGLRPSRHGGVRIEEDSNGLKAPDGVSVRLIHAYGHGGFGYQASWGTANEVLRILEG
ncbi:FAD dependent oxidoreductase [Atractiella rhizophila]|nr:FAD dependent oxidoreductase [Atractiella rhizophila]